LQSIYYSYSLGLGLSYNLCRHLAIYAEPELQGSITALSKNTPVSSYPFLAGITGGITWHF